MQMLYILYNHFPFSSAIFLVFFAAIVGNHLPLLPKQYPSQYKHNGKCGVWLAEMMKMESQRKTHTHRPHMARTKGVGERDRVYRNRNTQSCFFFFFFLLPFFSLYPILCTIHTIRMKHSARTQLLEANFIQKALLTQQTLWL